MNNQISTSSLITTAAAFVLSFFIFISASSQSPSILFLKDSTTAQSGSVAPLSEILVLNCKGKIITVYDGKGKQYFQKTGTASEKITIGRNLGKQKVVITDRRGKLIWQTTFNVDAQTSIIGGGKYTDMFNMFYNGMEGEETRKVTWNGKDYRFFVPWGLDHYHTMKGMKYFKGYGNELVDLFRQTQRSDGMIYSFVQTQANVDYFRTRDSLYGYTQKIGDRYFVRQPTENHPEYIYVNTIYQCWKSSGNDRWMKQCLSSAFKALSYSITDPARFSTKYGLLKRVYTIDSWDFQIDDKYTPNLGITNSMMVDANKSKFGIFFGDNTGYIQACTELAEMYRHSNSADTARILKQRAEDMQKKLDRIAWNGNFYTHFIDEDSTVIRDIGVDMKQQLAQSNAYTINRGIPDDKNKAIIEQYLQLKQHLPHGSPGEWYAIYPPFEKGFEMHNKKWQYMNGGVGGHVAGELARGAFENGYEEYSIDILNRLYDLGLKYGNKIWFAYTGAMPEQTPSPKYKTVDLTSIANMDLSYHGSKKSKPWMATTRVGDDVARMPTGNQTFVGIPFDIADPAMNERKSAVAVSNREGFQSHVTININSTAGSIYLLHTATKPTSETIVGSISFHYTDGSKVDQYISMGKHLAYWWFSELSTQRSGIAWYGSNQVSKGVGISWCAIDNPHAEKTIQSIVVNAPEDNGIYTICALTLSDIPHPLPIDPVSYGGPDNWANATAMAALIEGLVGIKDSPESKKYDHPQITPRWWFTNQDSVSCIVRYPASDAYVAYSYLNDKKLRRILINVTGNGQDARIQIPVKTIEKNKPRVMCDRHVLSYELKEDSSCSYLSLDVSLSHEPSKIEIDY